MSDDWGIGIDKRYMATTFGAWLFMLLLSVAFWIGVGFVAWHFISKVW